MNHPFDYCCLRLIATEDLDENNPQGVLLKEQIATATCRFAIVLDDSDNVTIIALFQKQAPAVLFFNALRELGTLANILLDHDPEREPR